MTTAPDERASRTLISSAVGIFLAARAVGLVMLFLVAQRLQPMPAAAQPFRGWHNLLTRWDAVYYEIIATRGYPRSVPIDMHGDVVQNVWAFFPVFPMLTRLLMSLTRLDFATAALVVNLVAGAIAAALLALAVRRMAGPHAARGAVALWSFFPTSFVLQVPYSEAVYLALVAGFLLALLTARFGMAALLLLITGLSRGYLLPLSAAAFAAVAEWLWHRRRVDVANGRVPLPWWTTLANEPGPGWLLVVSIAAPFLWMAIVGAVTGRPDAYALTQRAWGYTLDPHLWLERWPETMAQFGSAGGATVGIAVLAAAGALMLAGLRLALPLFMKVYMLSATGLLFMLALPGSVAFGSLPRFMLGILTVPIVLAMTVRRTAVRLAIVAGFTAVQYLWLLNTWSGRLGVAP